MRAAAIVNWTPLPKRFSLIVPVDEGRVEALHEDDLIQSVVALFSPENRVKSIAIWTIWACFGFGYYGVILLISRVYSYDDDGEDAADDTCSFDYQSIFLSSISEIAGILCVQQVINSWGRVKSQMFFYSGAAIAVVLYAQNISPHAEIDEVFGGVARGFAMSATAATWVASPELYPTEIRATGHAFCSAVARLGALLSPYVVMSDLAVGNVGIIIGISNIVAAVAVGFTPETAGAVMDKTGLSGRKQSRSDSMSSDLEKR